MNDPYQERNCTYYVSFRTLYSSSVIFTNYPRRITVLNAGTRNNARFPLSSHQRIDGFSRATMERLYDFILVSRLCLYCLNGLIVGRWRYNILGFTSFTQRNGSYLHRAITFPPLQWWKCEEIRMTDMVHKMANRPRTEHHLLKNIFSFKNLHDSRIYFYSHKNMTWLTMTNHIVDAIHKSPQKRTVWFPSSVSFRGSQKCLFGQK